jgi:hypothetical protein
MRIAAFPVNTYMILIFLARKLDAALRSLRQTNLLNKAFNVNSDVPANICSCNICIPYIPLDKQGAAHQSRTTRFTLPSKCYKI